MLKVATYPSKFAYLPEELLRDTFELAAVLDRSAALKLTLVSSWVRRWIEPLLFHTVVLYSARSLRAFILALSSKPPSFPKTYVKHLGIFALGPIQSIDHILSACREVTSLACGFSIPNFKEKQGYAAIQRFHHLKEQHLLGLSCRDAWDTSLVGSSVTHLRVHLSSFPGSVFPLALSPNENDASEAGWRSLGHLTALSHLAIVYRPLHNSSFLNILACFRRLLNPSVEGPKICLILVQVVESSLRKSSIVDLLNEAATQAGSDLLRVVAERAPASPMVQWEQVAGGQSIWANAEQVLNSRLTRLSRMPGYTP